LLAELAGPGAVCREAVALSFDGFWEVLGLAAGSFPIYLEVDGILLN
jgi:hypothetical protein